MVCRAVGKLVSDNENVIIRAAAQTCQYIYIYIYIYDITWMEEIGRIAVHVIV